MISIDKLTNGLTVGIDVKSDVETVYVAIATKTGSRNESARINGISHFLEHMLFKGTKTRTSLDIAEAVEFIGASMNAYTSRECTVYHIKALATDIELVFQILSDMVINSTLSQDEINLERGVIIQELSRSLDDPMDCVGKIMQNAAYGDSSMGRTVLGTKEIIEKLERRDFIEYMKEHYTADKMILAVCGNVKPDQVMMLAEKYFSGITKSSGSSKPEKAQYIGGTKMINNPDLNQAHILMCMHAFSAKDERRFATHMLSRIFGGGSSSRLFQEIREKLGLAYAVYSYVETYYDTGMFAIYAAVVPESIEKTISTIITEIKKMVFDIKPKELEMSMNHIKATTLMSYEDISYRGEKLIEDLMMHGRYIHNEEILDKTASVSIENIQDLCRTLIDDCKSKPATFGIYGKILTENIDDLTNQLTV